MIKNLISGVVCCALFAVLVVAMVDALDAELYNNCVAHSQTDKSKC